MENILEDNEKLVKKFGASRVSNLKSLPDFYTFKKGLIYSHRDLDKFLKDNQNDGENLKKWPKKLLNDNYLFYNYNYL